MSKLKRLDELIKVVEGLKKKGRKIVFTNGCFDLLHLGHIRYLREAKRLGDILIVGLNSDNSVRSLKGRERPLVKEKDRTEILSALEVVDYIVIFDELTPKNLIDSITPHILVKGGDWKREDVVGRDTVEAHGGEVVIIPEVKGYSTSALIKKIQKAS
ncbi:D-glycero-beta-D-manno-heptose 1-phosphate adenylyltransferase [bacterium]|nr:D-glycero-beta-D-manno-heptose 1-phosphate adenylyltransferase [bacterium]MCG2677581.1 D-glycero-beta-D-manno-heptose 1-phosphate adenylyltransferase [bacterium]